MNGDVNYGWIEEHSRVHFITTYSIYSVQDLAETKLDRFGIADTTENRRFIEDGRVEGGCCRQNLSIEEIMDDMRHLHYVLSVKKGSRTPEPRLETPQ